MPPEGGPPREAGDLAAHFLGLFKTAAALLAGKPPFLDPCSAIPPGLAGDIETRRTLCVDLSDDALRNR